ncbi:MAG: monovalent cation:H+ antiporter-2, family [Frankiales bacterium]|nr:monovalent cation:H+ antiporter-2, family [Frankiales bacterium]MDX6273349.1 monovalent cation:H+ antiporter-2, family [Frankiales bacterium]
MHAARLLVELGATLLVLSFVATQARRVGLSPIPLYLLAGLAFGSGGLVPLDASADFIRTGADLGVVLLLFSLGLEYSGAELVAGLRRHAPDGVLDLLLNATPGAVAALLLGWGATGALVLAGVTAVSSSGIVAQVLTDLGRLANRETPVVLSLLVLEDVAMAAYLPVLTTVLSGIDVAGGALRVGLALAAVALILIAAVRYTGRLSTIVGGERTSDDVLVMRTLGLVLLVAGLAQQLQASAAVGAFLVGVAISGPIVQRAGDLISPLRDVFAAVFFVFFGLQLDPATIPGVVLPATALASVSLLSKVATGWLAARRAGVGRAGRRRAGVALVPRGEFSIVIAGLAVASGLPARLGALAATYVLLLACAGPVLARFIGVPRARTSSGNDNAPRP